MPPYPGWSVIFSSTCFPHAAGVLNWNGCHFDFFFYRFLLVHSTDSWFVVSSVSVNESLVGGQWYIRPFNFLQFLCFNCKMNIIAKGK